MKYRYLLLLALLVLAAGVHAFLINDRRLDLFPEVAPLAISGAQSTNKVKLLRMNDGALVAIYGEAQDGGPLAYDAKAQATRKPFDIVVGVSTDNGDTWGSPINVSNTADLSSSLGIIEGTGAPTLGPDGHPDLGADPRALPYPGDSDKPNVFNVGNQIIITYGNTYCPGGQQRFVVYPELNGVTVPYSCLYVTRMRWNSTTQGFDTVWPGGLPYLTERLSNGLRDIKQDANRGNSSAFVINWQEDPLGLKLGEAEGPGDGASGANVNNGTDI
jgi:hypothetical protein